MSCNGCRVLRKGCSDSCILRSSLQWIDSAEAQGHATVFVAKFFGRAGMISFINAVSESQRPALFQSLLYEACGRTVNPVYGAVGLLWSGNWSVCQAAVETVLKGGTLKPASNYNLGSAEQRHGLASASPTFLPLPSTFQRNHISNPNANPSGSVLDEIGKNGGVPSGGTTTTTKKKRPRSSSLSPVRTTTQQRGQQSTMCGASNRNFDMATTITAAAAPERGSAIATSAKSTATPRTGIKQKTEIVVPVPRRVVSIAPHIAVANASVSCAATAAMAADMGQSQAALQQQEQPLGAAYGMVAKRADDDVDGQFHEAGPDWMTAAASLSQAATASSSGSQVAAVELSLSLNSHHHHHHRFQEEEEEEAVPPQQQQEHRRRVPSPCSMMSVNSSEEDSVVTTRSVGPAAAGSGEELALLSCVRAHAWRGNQAGGGGGRGERVQLLNLLQF